MNFNHHLKGKHSRRLCSAVFVPGLFCVLSFPSGQTDGGDRVHTQETSEALQNQKHVITFSN